jgi:hypothetical protein
MVTYIQYWEDIIAKLEADTASQMHVVIWILAFNRLNSNKCS